MLLLPDKQGNFYVPLLKTKVEQDFTHLPVLPDKLGKFYVPLFNSKSGTSHREAESRRGQYTAGGEISDTLPFFVVCRYFRRIYRLPRTLDTLFSQSTLIEKTFPFSLSRALVQKRCVKCVRRLYFLMDTGKVPTHYFFAIVCQNPKSDMPAPLLYPDSRPEPAARRAANPSIERERDAHLHPPSLPLTFSEPFQGTKKPARVTEYPNGLKTS